MLALFAQLNQNGLERGHVIGHTMRAVDYFLAWALALEYKGGPLAPFPRGNLVLSQDGFQVAGCHVDVNHGACLRKGLKRNVSHINSSAMCGEEVTRKQVEIAGFLEIPRRQTTLLCERAKQVRTARNRLNREPYVATDIPISVSQARVCTGEPARFLR
jgi:hypothetical protein